MYLRDTHDKHHTRDTHNMHDTHECDVHFWSPMLQWNAKMKMWVN